MAHFGQGSPAFRGLSIFFVLSFSACGNGEMVGPPQEVEGEPFSVLSTSPEDGDFFVSLDTVIEAVFNRDVMADTVKDRRNFTVVRVGGDARSPIPAEISYDAASRTARFTPLNPLMPSNYYIARVRHRVQDVDGVRLQDDQQWGFYTEAPRIETLAHAPGVDAGEVNVKTVLRVDFPEPMWAKTINPNTFVLQSVSGIRVSGRVVFVDQSAVFVPTEPLQTGTTYSATLTSDIQSLQGGALEPVAWEFTTAGTERFSAQFGSVYDDRIKAVASDALGNVFVAGVTWGRVGRDDIGRGDGTNGDCFLAKMTAAGRTEWVQQFGTPEDDIVHALSLDSLGNIYVAGETAGALDDQTAAVGADLFLAKFSPGGSRLWIDQVGSPGGDEVAYGIAAGPNDEIYVGGYTNDVVGEGISLGRGQSDGLLLKYNPNGEQLWLRQFGTAHDDQVNSVAIDSEGNVYLGGYTTGDFLKPDAPSPKDTDGFVIAFNPDGVGRWRDVIRTPAFDDVHGIALDSSDNIYLTGATLGNIATGDVGSGDQDVYLAKYNVFGGRVWVKQAGSDTAEDESRAVAVAGREAVYIAGYTHVESPAAGGASAPGSGDGFTGTLVTVTKFAGEGSELSLAWTKQDVLGAFARADAYGIAVTPDGGVVVGGGVHGSVDGSAVIGGEDGFLIKLAADGSKL